MELITGLAREIAMLKVAPASDLDRSRPATASLIGRIGCALRGLS